MPLSHILNAEIVNNENKNDGAPTVTPQAGCGGRLIVPVFPKALVQEVVGELTGLFYSVDPLRDFEVDPSGVLICGEVIFINGFGWDILELDAYILRTI